jgi:hypothetical protein
LLIGGANPVAVDLALSRLMGFRWKAIPTLRHAMEAGNWPLLEGCAEQVRIVSGSPRWQDMSINEPGDSLHFEPHQGWRGHVEL